MLNWGTKWKTGIILFHPYMHKIFRFSFLLFSKNLTSSPYKRLSIKQIFFKNRTKYSWKFYPYKNEISCKCLKFFHCWMRKIKWSFSSLNTFLIFLFTFPKNLHHLHVKVNYPFLSLDLFSLFRYSSIRLYLLIFKLLLSHFFKYIFYFIIIFCN